MSTILFILAAIAAVYLYAVVAFYYEFKNLTSFCGCEETVCGPREPAITREPAIM